jgi:hypothetical protein
LGRGEREEDRQTDRQIKGGEREQVNLSKSDGTSPLMRSKPSLPKLLLNAPLSNTVKRAIWGAQH